MKAIQCFKLLWCLVASSGEDKLCLSWVELHHPVLCIRKMMLILKLYFLNEKL